MSSLLFFPHVSDMSDDFEPASVPVSVTLEEEIAAAIDLMLIRRAPWVVQIFPSAGVEMGSQGMTSKKKSVSPTSLHFSLKNNANMFSEPVEFAGSAPNLPGFLPALPALPADEDFVPGPGVQKMLEVRIPVM